MNCRCNHTIQQHGNDRMCFFCSCRRFVDVKPTPGTCGVCGCTENMACDGGCEWADEAKTLCTACEDAA